MSVQRSLTSFFKPVQTKRVSSDSSEVERNAKKLKLETCKKDETEVSPHTGTKQTDESSEGTSPINKVLTGSPKLGKSDDDVKGADIAKESAIKSEPRATDKTEDAIVPEKEPSYSQRSTQEAKDDNSTGSPKLGKSDDDDVKGADIAKESAIKGEPRATEKTEDAIVPEKEPSYSQRSTQEVKDDNVVTETPDDITKNGKKEVLKDVTKEDGNTTNFTTPVKSEPKFISTPLGMLSPLQCLAKIKSQCAKTPALHHSIGPSWFFALQGEFSKPYFSKLSEFLTMERKRAVIYPPEYQVWTWTQLCGIKDVKVVILGQDPYHNPGQAHGLCFSVQKGIHPPPSLINMYRELESDIPGFKAPSHGHLIGWAQQGVLLLNACLTVRANIPNSHKERGWEQLTDAVIKRLSDTGSGIVFLLWGSYAQKKGSFVNKKKHHVLQAPHPSPLSAHRGFFGCKHFSKCNALLKQGGKKPIDWAHLPLV